MTTSSIDSTQKNPKPMISHHEPDLKKVVVRKNISAMSEYAYPNPVKINEKFTQILRNSSEFSPPELGKKHERLRASEVRAKKRYHEQS